MRSRVKSNLFNGAPGLLAFCLILITACSSSKDDTLETPPPSYDNSLKTFSEFEGRTVTLASTLESISYEWEQTSGPTFDIGSSSSQQLTLTLPWIDDDLLTAEFTVTANIDNQTVTQPLNLRILNRGFIVLQVRDESSTNLFLNYVSENDEDGVPDLNTIQLTNLSEGAKTCGFSTSPNGRYVSFTTTTNDDNTNQNCGGLKVVDIETQLVQNITPLDRHSEAVKLRNYSWAPDSLQIVYVGDHGEDVDQIYVARVYKETVSYIDYRDYEGPSGEWPSEDLFPIGDGGNYVDLEPVENNDIGNLFWLGDSNGIGFSLYNQETGDSLPYQAASHGKAQVLERNTLVVADLYESERDTFEADLLTCDAEKGWICAVPSYTPERLTKITRQFSNPEWMASSVDGQLAQIITMITSNDEPMKVLSVRQPVIDGEVILKGTPIEATEVITAQWSPIDSSLAFSSHSDYRHRHGYVETYQEVRELIGYEVPDQLYWYPNYQQGHEEGQERLSRPQDSIDDNAVREIEWSSNGQLIAYARGEAPETTAGFLTSLWITQLDEVNDDSQQTIDANTTLLDAVSDESSFYSDFDWSPNSEGVISIFHSDEGARLRYFDRAGEMLFESPYLLGAVTDALWFISASFSPAGDFFAYLDREEVSEGEFQPAIYIYDLVSGERTKIETPDLTPSGIITQGIQWSPHGDAILYSVRPTNTSSRIFYLANMENRHEDLSQYFDLEQEIIRARVDHFQGLANFSIGPIN